MTIVPKVRADRTLSLQGRPKTRFLLAAACSLAIHVGIAGIASLRMKEEPATPPPIEEPAEPPSTPPLPPQVRVESPALSEAERTQLLERFKAEKQELIKQTTRDLRAGKFSMLLSDFKIKSEVLDHNISALESGSGNLIDENMIRGKYASALREISNRADNIVDTGEKLDELHYLSHRNLFRGYLIGSSGIITIFTEGTFNCATSTEFLAVLEADIINSDKYGIVLLDPPKNPAVGTTGHMLSWFKDETGLWQIENTDGGYPRRVHFERGLRVPKEMMIAAYLVRNGVPVNKLPRNLARLYRRGVGQGGYPVAGVSTDGPDPPDQLIPNPYFVVDTLKIIREARAVATMLAFFRDSENQDPTSIDLSLIKISKEVDWCEMAESTVRWDFYWTSPPPLEIGNEAQTRHRQTTAVWGDHFDQFMELMYMASVKTADMLSQAGDQNYASCNRENEYLKFENLTERILAGDNINNTYYFIFMHSLANPQKSRELLLKIYKSPNASQTVREEAFYWICKIHSPEDFELIKEVFLNDQPSNPNYWPSLYALSRMQGEKAKEAADLIFSAYSQKKDYNLIIGLALQGYARPALDYIAENPGVNPSPLLPDENNPIWTENNPLWNENNPIWQKRALSNVLSQFHPDAPFQEKDLQLLKTLIQNEADVITRANLIALWANLGNTEEALTYVERDLLPLLEKTRLDNAFEAGILVLSLGKINAPRIREWLLSILEIHPVLAVEIGDVFVRHNFRSETVIRELKKILNNTGTDSRQLADIGETPGRRAYAALLLILMNEL